ncbi:uncharacterized protein A4U43_C04F20190 [Asparagus officinalis]|uniref:Uncharacterized protein n=1 Tax=Asparagus officinalis TaxID=4686 RepID=A0A5P1F2X4_ASPOF|nr:uncharacterized protein A4U43_C04F20190 [Asparagus officinalis]
MILEGFAGDDQWGTQPSEGSAGDERDVWRSWAAERSCSCEAASFGGRSQWAAERRGPRVASSEGLAEASVAASVLADEARRAARSGNSPVTAIAGTVCAEERRGTRPDGEERGSDGFCGG